MNIDSLISFMIVFIVNVWIAIRYPGWHKKIMFTNAYPSWFRVLIALYIVWGIFNLINVLICLKYLVK